MVALALAAGVVLGVPAGAWAATKTVCASGCDYSSINTAVNTEPAATTFNVLQGVYNEDVSIPSGKSGDIINGNQSGNDARSRSGNNESIVNGGFSIASNMITIDGFTIQGNNGPGVSALSTISGYQILNNIIQNNLYGIDAENSGTDASNVQQNLLSNNNNGSGTGSENGVFANVVTKNLTVDNNDFNGHNGHGIEIIGTGNDEITVTNNTDDAGFVFSDVSSPDVNNNSISNTGDDGMQFNSGSTDIHVNDNTINNPGDEGIEFSDVSNVTNDGNAISGGQHGVRVAGGVDDLKITGDTLRNANGAGVLVIDDGDGPNSNVELTGNQILNNGDGLEVDDAAHTGSVEFHFNRVVGNGGNSGVVNNDANDQVKAANNWWGCNEGPGVSGTGCDQVDGDVDFDPWLVLSLKADPNSVPKKGTSDVTASLLKNSDGNEPSGNNFPDGTSIKFGAKLGSVNPSSDTTQNGEAQTTFKAGKDTGKGKVKAVLDNEKAKLPIQVTGG